MKPWNDTWQQKKGSWREMGCQPTGVRCVTSSQDPTRWCGGIHGVDLRSAFSQCLLKLVRKPWLDFLENLGPKGFLLGIFETLLQSFL